MTGTCIMSTRAKCIAAPQPKGSFRTLIGGRRNRETPVMRLMSKVENLPVVLVLCSALFGAFLLVEAGQTSQWPPEVNRTVEQALELANQTYTVRAREYRGGSVEKVSEIARQFDQTLDKLATQLDKTRCEQLRNSEEQEIHRKLATIACDKFNRQRPYEEIARIYLKGVDNPQAVF